MEARRLSWGAIIGGALVTAALLLVFIGFGVSLGLALGSPAPTWRDSSFPFWVASGLYLLLAVMISTGAGGYAAGRLQPHAPDPDLEENELRAGCTAWRSGRSRSCWARFWCWPARAR